MAACLNERVALYKIDFTGPACKLIKLLEFTADFKKEEPAVNVCRFSTDNRLIGTGGDDCVARVFQLNPDNAFKHEGEELKPALCLEGHFEPINCLDFSSDSKLLVTSSGDYSCLIFNCDLKSPTKGQRLHKLTFGDGLQDSKNLLMRGCFFSGQNVYTMATQTRRKSYIIKWRPGRGKTFADKAEPPQAEAVTEVHPNTASGLRVSQDGSQVAIGTSDGWVKVIKESALARGEAKFIFAEKRHRLPVTCLGFRHGPSGAPEWLFSGSPDYTYNVIRCTKSFIVGLLSYIVWTLSVTLLLLAAITSIF